VKFGVGPLEICWDCGTKLARPDERRPTAADTHDTPVRDLT
jgi:hypothetical protein